ncbi:MAG TPA: S8 family serine peptidase, partial [Kineosporiaceae bacterium]|nr:S8 family serine peptidase [Kineosporiaceae bacterium]
TATHTRDAWSATDGSGVVVATIDSGADTTTPDLAGRLLAGAHLDPVSGLIVAGARPDVLGHGTHVAGVIVGNDDGHGITGVAPGAKVLPINVDTGDNVLSGKDVAAALHWAASHGARVVNLSLGFSELTSTASDLRIICQAVSDVVARNVVVVAAAGNDGQGQDSAEAPARCPGAISVSAVDNDLRPASWSSFDGSVTIAAPGASIYSAVTTAASPLRFATESGTSMASPFVAGTAALVVAQHPDWTPAMVMARLTETASDVPPAGRDPRTGAGVVDPPAAVGVRASAPVAVPWVGVQADPYASRVNSAGRQVYDQVMLHWVPDPTVAVTGYRVTRWTAAGTATTKLAGDAIRAFFPNGPAGYTVTALTDQGEVGSAPLWFPMPGQDMTPVYPVTGLKATWTSAGAVQLTWSNPRQNRGAADEYAVLLNGDLAASGEKVTVPTQITIPARNVPSGDLVISMLIGSSSSLDTQETKVSLPARVPFSGTAVAAGRGRYRVDLVLATSRRALCGRSRCTGTTVTVTASGWAHTTRIDSRGHAVVLISGRPRGGRLTVAARVAGKPKLSDRAVTVTAS